MRSFLVKYLHKNAPRRMKKYRPLSLDSLEIHDCNGRSHLIRLYQNSGILAAVQPTYVCTIEAYIFWFY